MYVTIEKRFVEGDSLGEHSRDEEERASTEAGCCGGVIDSEEVEEKEVEAAR